MIALLPLLVALALLAVHMGSVLAAASEAQDQARARAMRATGAAGQVVTVTGSARPPALAALGTRGEPVRVRAAVQVP